MPPPAVTALTQPKLLIGEGQDEVHFFTSFIKFLGLTDIHVEQYGGKANLGKYLKEFATVRPGRNLVVSLGITRDADASATAVLQSISSLLTNNGLVVPPAAGQFASGPPNVGVYIMPDNQREGMLEDLCLDSVQVDLAFPCVDDFLQCVEQKANRKPKNRAKARVHAWLASQLEPDLRLGEAAQKQLWPWTSPAFAELQ